MRFEAAGGRGAAAALLAELHQGLVVLLLLLLLLLVPGQDEEEPQDALQVAIPDLWRGEGRGKGQSPPRLTSEISEQYIDKQIKGSSAEFITGKTFRQMHLSSVFFFTE